MDVHISKLAMGRHGFSDEDELYPKRNYPIERIYEEKLLRTSKPKKIK